MLFFRSGFDPPRLHHDLRNATACRHGVAFSSSAPAVSLFARAQGRRSFRPVGRNTVRPILLTGSIRFSRRVLRGALKAICQGGVICPSLPTPNKKTFGCVSLYGVLTYGCRPALPGSCGSSAVTHLMDFTCMSILRAIMVVAIYVTICTRVNNLRDVGR